MTPARLAYFKDVLGNASYGGKPILTKQEGLELVRALEEANRAIETAHACICEKYVGSICKADELREETVSLHAQLDESLKQCDELRRILSEERVQQDAIAEQKGRAYFRALAAREREKVARLVDDADEDLPKQMLAAEIRGKCFKHGNDPDTCAQCAELRLKDYSHHADEDDA